MPKHETVVANLQHTQQEQGKKVRQLNRRNETMLSYLHTDANHFAEQNAKDEHFLKL
jgi:hypothetical protein